MKEKIVYGIAIAMLIWIVTSTLEVQMHNLDANYVYNKANIWAILTTTETQMKVVNCEIDKATDTFEVTLEDIKGEQYAYFDTDFQYNGWIKEVKLQGKQIVDVKGVN